MHATAAVMNAFDSALSLEPIELAEPRPDEVLVEIAAVGICHTDLAFLSGAMPFPLPAILGHEGSGTVVAVGADVTKVAPGDRVAISFSSCGECPACTAGTPSYCHQFMALNYAGTRADGTSAASNDRGDVASNFFGQSSFATHSMTTERNLVVVADALPIELAGPLGCGVQTGAGAIMRSFAAPAGSSVLVLGGGSVGLSAVLGAVVQGCTSIVLVEPVAARRELAQELGATHTIDPADGPIADQVRTLHPAGVQYAFDTTGIPSVITDAYGCLGAQGVLGLVGVPADLSATLEVPVIQGLFMGITIKFILEGDSDPDTFIPELVQLHLDGRFPFDRLVTTMPFSQVNEAIASQIAGEAVKVVLVHDAP